MSHSCWHQPARPPWPPFTPLPAAPQTTSVQLHIHTCHVVSHRTSHCAESCNLWQWHCSLAASRPPTSKVGCHMHHPTVHRYRALDHRVGPITSLGIDTNNRYGCRYPASGLCLIFQLLPSAAICLQCFDAVGWASGRASGLYKLSDGCQCGYLSAARCWLFAYGPADATAIQKPPSGAIARHLCIALLARDLVCNVVLRL